MARNKRFTTKAAIRLALLLSTILMFVCAGPPDSRNYICNKEAHEQCARLAGPLLRDPKLVFPDNIDDIELVCRTWDSFVDCLKTYVERCFSESQRVQFNRAVQSPVQSVHRMCADPDYQYDYLKYAPCIKSTVTEHRHCGDSYRQLAEQVAPHGGMNSNELARATLCCSYDAFERCVSREARNLCDQGRPNGPASMFVEEVLGKALGFLGEQCANYIPNSGDCLPSSDAGVSTVGSGGSNKYPRPANYNPYGRTVGWDPTDHLPVNQQSTPDVRISPSSAPSMSSPTWSPSRSVPRDEVYLKNNGFPSSTTPRPQPAWLTERTTDRPTSQSPNYYTVSTPEASEDTFTVSHRSARPLGYGRSMAWTPSPAPSSSEKPDWATMPTRNSWSNEASVTQTWYPVAGSYAGNTVDEPNQQGLSKQLDNGTNTNNEMCIPFILSAFVLLNSIYYSWSAS